MARVLLVDDDHGTAEGCAGTLREAHFVVDIAYSASTALDFVRRESVDLVLSDLRLPDASGLDLLRQFRFEIPQVPIVIVTGFGDVRSAVEAIRLGASDYVEKPLFGDELVAVVERSITNDAAAACLETDADTPYAHAAARWAVAVVPLLSSGKDPKTLESWGRCIGASPSAIKNWCRMAHVSPRRSLIFARLLRAVLLARAHGFRAEDALDVADRRTLTALLRLSGIPWTDDSRLPDSPDEFLASQKLITDGQALLAVKRLLRSRDRSKKANKNAQ